MNRKVTYIFKYIKPRKWNHVENLKKRLFGFFFLCFKNRRHTSVKLWNWNRHESISTRHLTSGHITKAQKRNAYMDTDFSEIISYSYFTEKMRKLVSIGQSSHSDKFLEFISIIWIKMKVKKTHIFQRNVDFFFILYVLHNGLFYILS